LDPVPGVENPAGAMAVLAGGGELGGLMRALDWSQTPLGPFNEWPQSLRTSASICLASRFPIVLYWGPELVVLYNDAYSQILGSKHPWALGQTCRVCWAEIWDTIGPMLAGVLTTGEATWSDDLLLLLQRYEYPEECYFSFSFSPVRVESGEVGGVFTAVIETTENVIGERRLRTLRDLAARSATVRSEEETWQLAAATLAENPADIPFAVLCQPSGEGLQTMGTAGIEPAHWFCEELCRTGSSLFNAARGVATTGVRAKLDLGSYAGLPCGSWATAPHEAIALPVSALGLGASAVLVAAVSPAKALDESYGTFFELVARQIATSMADARAYEEERRSHLRMAAMRQEATEREARLRAEAENERRRLQELLTQTPAAIGLMSGPDHRWTYVNDLYVRVTGRTGAADFLGKTARASLPELNDSGFWELLDEVYRTGQPYVGREQKARLRSGSGEALADKYFDFVYQPLRDAEGRVEGVLVHAVEVTSRVQARMLVEQHHERLQEAHLASQRLAAIVESSDDAIISKDLNGVVTSWNRCAERMFGYTAEEMIGRSVLTLIPPELHADEERILSSLRAGKGIEHFETVRVAKSGERIEVSLSISPMRDEAGRIVGASKIARDITQHKKAERALRTTEKLASVGRLAATMAHEINNPLESVTNLVYLARETSKEDPVRQFLTAAEEELARVAVLTRQTLGFYRDTRATATVQLGELVAPLVSAFHPRARNKGVEIGVEAREHRKLHGFAGEMRQLIANLMTNSIDAVPARGRVRIRVSDAREWRGSGRSGVRLTIADNGCGIPAGLWQELFEPFFTTKKDVGTGLGLWVCKSIVENHGGSIRIRSSTAPGRSGTAFSIFLPAESESIELKAAG
jgi:PAS domain S-box-containing protein